MLLVTANEAVAQQACVILEPVATRHGVKLCSILRGPEDPSECAECVSVLLVPVYCGDCLLHKGAQGPVIRLLGRVVSLTYGSGTRPSETS